MSERIEIVTDVQHMKRIIKAIVCPAELCTEDHKISGTNQLITHAAIVQWLDNLFTIGSEALKRAASSSVMGNRNLVLEADIRAAMGTFCFDGKVPFIMQQTDSWGNDDTGTTEQW